MNRPTMIELLGQDGVWVDGGGNRHAISAMDLRYCQNLHAYLLRNSEGLVAEAGSAVMGGPVVRGEVACDGFDAVLDELDQASADSVAWVRRQPLMRALEERIRRLGEEADEGTSRTVTVVLHLKVPRGDGSSAVRRAVGKALRGLPYEHEITMDAD